MNSTEAEQPHEGHRQLNDLVSELGKAVIGQEEVKEHVLTALIAGGHVLIEGVPGLGKTLLVRALALCIGGNYKRIQFTPDLMPSDITGHAVYNVKTEDFHIRKGPIFTNLCLADEINRAPAKTQAALLEVMQERQITIEGTPYEVADPFMVLATQNPIEQEGTYPLPEAELDRFVMKLYIDYPSEADESALVEQVTFGHRQDVFPVEQLRPVLTTAELTALQGEAAKIPADRAVIDYAVNITRATREWPGLARGAGPRGSIAMMRCARARALMNGLGFVTPDDVKSVAKPVLRHRVLVTAELEIDGTPVDAVLGDLLDQVEAPRQ